LPHAWKNFAPFFKDFSPKAKFSNIFAPNRVIVKFLAADLKNIFAGEIFYPFGVGK
jgi:hypothetical protein